MTYACISCRTALVNAERSLDGQYGFGYCRACRRQQIGKMLAGQGQARRSDPVTSHEAALKVRPGSARAALLQAHVHAPDGLTDEEACEAAGLSLASEYATRCSELMRAGLLRDTTWTRTGSSGMQRLVRTITDEGRRVASSAEAKAA